MKKKNIFLFLLVLLLGFIFGVGSVKAVSCLGPRISSIDYNVGDKFDDKSQIVELEVDKSLQLYFLSVYGNDLATPDMPMGIYVNGKVIPGVTWSSSNPSVATVDVNGLVTAISTGDVVITASTNKWSGDSACGVVNYDDTTGTPVTTVSKTYALTIKAKAEPKTEDPKNPGSSNPKTGSFTSYVVLAGGVLLAVGAIVIVKKNTKIHKI